MSGLISHFNETISDLKTENAKLRVANKVLLEALKKILTDYDERVEIYGPDPQLAKVKVIELARAAISQAERP